MIELQVMEGFAWVVLVGCVGLLGYSLWQAWQMWSER